MGQEARKFETAGGQELPSEAGQVHLQLVLGGGEGGKEGQLSAMDPDLLKERRRQFGMRAGRMAAEGLGGLRVAAVTRDSEVITGIYLYRDEFVPHAIPIEEHQELEDGTRQTVVRRPYESDIHNFFEA